MATTRVIRYKDRQKTWCSRREQTRGKSHYRTTPMGKENIVKNAAPGCRLRWGHWGQFAVSEGGQKGKGSCIDTEL